MCPTCFHEDMFWNLGYEKDGSPKKEFTCPKCNGKAEKELFHQVQLQSKMTILKRY